jgi:hypothetical protein
VRVSGKLIHLGETPSNEEDAGAIAVGRVNIGRSASVPVNSSRHDDADDLKKS